jgi:hypothetical protein
MRWIRRQVHPVDRQEPGRVLTNTIRTMRALVLTLAATAAVAGCGGSSSGQPRTLPAVSASPSPSAVPSVAPTGINAPTPQGAADFARYVYAQIERAFATKDPALIQALSTPACDSCNNLIASLKRVVANNEHVVGYRITVQAAVAPATTATTARVDVIRETTGGEFISAAGRVVLREPALHGIEERMDLVRAGGTWRVAQIVRVRVRQ